MVTRFSERRIFRSSIHIHLGGSRSRSIDEGSGSLEFHLDPHSKKLVPGSSSKGGTKDRAPEFIVKPRRQYINEGETGKFKASYEGTPDTELTWSVNGKLITSDERHKLYKENDCYMLEVLNAETSDQGAYVCKISNAAGSTTAETELEVFVRPQQTKGKTSKFVAPAVDIGLEDTEFVDRQKDATLVCTFHNATDAKASWFKDSKELGKWQATASFDGRMAKLVVREASRRTCGVYECVVRNSGGEAKTRCLVSLLDPSVKPIAPKFTLPLSDQTIEVGEKLVLEAEVTGKPRPSLTWFKEKMELAANEEIRIDYKDGRGRLIVDNLDQTDALKFTCVAKNVAGEETSISTVSVTAGTSELREPPIFTQELHNMEVDDGDRVEMSVEVKGTPPIDVVWVHNNREIPPTDPVCRMVNDGNVRKLVIPEVFPEDSGEYVCEAYNEYGDTDTFCRLTVNEVSDKDSTPEVTQRCPEFETRPEKLHVTTGTSAILKCRVSGEPPPSVLWSKGTTTIKHGSQYKISSIGDEHFLEILNCSQSDNSQYTCNLSNVAGTASASARVIVEDKGQQPSDFRSVLKKRSQKSLEASSTSSTESRKTNSDPNPAKSQGFKLFNGKTISDPSSPNREGLKLFNGHLKQTSSSSSQSPGEKKGGIHQIDFRCVLKNKAKPTDSTADSSASSSYLSDSSSDSDRLFKDSEVPKSGYKSKAPFSRSFPSNSPGNLSNSELSGAADSRKQDIHTLSDSSNLHTYSKVVIPKQSRFLHKSEETTSGKKDFSVPAASSTELNSRKSSLISKSPFMLNKPGEVVKDNSAFSSNIGREIDKKDTTTNKTGTRDQKSWNLEQPVRDKDLKKLNGEVKDTISNKTEIRDQKSLNSGQSVRDKDLKKLTNGEVGNLSQKRQLFEKIDSKVNNLPPKSVQHSLPSKQTGSSGNKVNQVLQKFETSSKETGFQPESKVSLKDRREHGASLSLSITDRSSRFKSPDKPDWSKSERKYTKTRSFEAPKSEFLDKYLSRGKSFELPKKMSKVTEFRSINIDIDHSSKDTRTNMDVTQKHSEVTKPNSSKDTKSNMEVTQKHSQDTKPITDTRTESQYKDTKSSTKMAVDQSNKSALHDSKPEFVRELENQTVSYGSEVILECGVTGTPAPEISWAVNDQKVKRSKFFKMSYEDSMARLIITEAFSEDEGEYLCIAKNNAGTSSTACKLAVQKDQRKSLDNSDVEDSEEPFSPTATPPKIYNISPTDFCILRGGTIEFKASYTSVPPGKVTWCRNRQEITSDERMHTDTDEHFSTLTITNIKQKDAGRYDIRVENALGYDFSNAWLTVEDVPDPPVGEPWVSEVTLTSAILSWSGPAYDGGCPITNYRVEICDAEEQEWTSVTTSCVSTTFRMENLTPHTPYFFRICAENKHGVSQPCQTSEVTVTRERRPSLASRLNSIESDDVFTHDTNDVCTPLSDYNEVCTPMSEYGIVSPLSPDEIPFEHREILVEKGRNFEQYYECREEIGKGKFGFVYKCIERSTGKQWAAKILKCRESEKKKIQMEVDIMNKLKHPKILMLWDVFEVPRKMILVMELIGGGELFERVIDDDFELTERDCIQFMRQILDAVNYMHNRNILHLDLKPENILCVKNESNKVKIIDFGLARFYNPGENVRVMFGTPEFIAPEVVNYDEIGFTTDMWSIGVICYVLLSGLSPFMGDSDAETLSNVTQGDFDFDDESFDNVSDDGKVFIEELLVKNKRKRLLSHTALEHRWLAEDAARLKTRKINTKNLKRFMARRKWQKTGNAIRALGRMTSLQKFTRPSPNNTSSANNSLADSPTSSSSSTLTLGSQGTIIEEKPVATSLKVSDTEEILVPKGQTGGTGGVKTTVNGSSMDNKYSNGFSLTKPVKDINSNVDSSNPTNQNSAFSGLKISSNENSNVSTNQNGGEESHVISANSQDGDKTPEANTENDLRSNKNLDYQNKNYKCPEFTKEMVESKAFPGDVVRFDVEFQGKTRDIKVTWYFEDDVIQEGPRHYVQETVEGSCSLIVKDICEDDDGEYSCKIQNEYGEDTCSAELIVYGAI